MRKTKATLGWEVIGRLILLLIILLVLIIVINKITGKNWLLVDKIKSLFPVG